MPGSQKIFSQGFFGWITLSKMTDSPTKALFQAMLRGLKDGGVCVPAEVLDLLAGETGDNRFRHASSILRGGSKGGRGRINDGAKMAAVRTLQREQGLKLSRAITIVAERYETPKTSAASVARRLRDRFKEEKLEETIPPNSGAGIFIP